MAEEKTFTQAEMDSIIEGRLARERQKYSDYEDLREKASKYDEYQEQIQTEKKKSEELQAKLSKLEKEDTVRQAREKVSKDMNVPVGLLSGEDEETCKKQAEGILKFAKGSHYPGVKGDKYETSKRSGDTNATDEDFKELVGRIFGRKE